MRCESVHDCAVCAEKCPSVVRIRRVTYTTMYRAITRASVVTTHADVSLDRTSARNTASAAATVRWSLWHCTKCKRVVDDMMLVLYLVSWVTSESAVNLAISWCVFYVSIDDYVSVLYYCVKPV